MSWNAWRLLYKIFRCKDTKEKLQNENTQETHDSTITFMMKIARLKKQTKLVALFMGMIKKSQLMIVLTLKAKARNCCKIALLQELDKE